MTTNITIDAHAGWDVLLRFYDPGNPQRGYTESKIIPRNTKETVAIWDNLAVNIVEMKDTVETQ